MKTDISNPPISPLAAKAEEVAATLGVTVSTFDVVLHRSLNALKKALMKSSGELDSGARQKETQR